MAAESPRVHNHHNVYVLGAGYSRLAGLPLMGDFMSQMRQALPWLEAASEDRSREIRAVERVLAFRLSAAGAAYRVHLDVENIEELFSLASSVGDRALDQAMADAICATIDFATKRRPDTALETKLCVPDHVVPRTGIYSAGPPAFHRPGHLVIKLDPYSAMGAVMASAFCPGLSHRNTAITFNYDTLLERPLTHMGLPWTYALNESFSQFDADAPGGPSDEPGCVKILKLHGSVNWVQRASFTVYRDYASARLVSGQPVIVPPTWRRKADAANQLAHVWDEAVSAIRDATNIVIIGFSMPDTDVHFKYLLAAGLRDNISLRTVKVVNPDVGEGLRSRVRGIIRSEFEDRAVLEFIEGSALDYLLNRECLQRIGRDSAMGEIEATTQVRDESSPA